MGILIREHPRNTGVHVYSRTVGRASSSPSPTHPSDGTKRAASAAVTCPRFPCFRFCRSQSLCFLMSRAIPVQVLLLMGDLGPPFFAQGDRPNVSLELNWKSIEKQWWFHDPFHVSTSNASFLPYVEGFETDQFGICLTSQPKLWLWWNSCLILCTFPISLTEKTAASNVYDQML